MCQSEQTVSTCEKLQSSRRICQLPLNAYGPLFVMQQCCHPGHIDDSLTFLVFSDSSSSVLSTSFLNGGLFKGSWLQQDSIMLYLQRQRRSLVRSAEQTPNHKQSHSASDQTVPLQIVTSGSTFANF